jgi:hypothetical protein
MKAAHNMMAIFAKEGSMKFRRPKRVLGARPPKGMEWVLGKTAATVSFVREAERFLDMCPPDRWGYPEAAVELLKKRVEELKSGDAVLFDRQDVAEFLEMNGCKR